MLHIQGDRDNVVYPEQHDAFQKDYEERGLDFRNIIVEGFGHAFAPVDSNAAGKTIDLRSEITDFFSNTWCTGTADSNQQLACNQGGDNPAQHRHRCPFGDGKRGYIGRPGNRDDDTGDR